MRKHIAELVRLWADFTKPNGVVYEFGSRLVEPEQREICNLRQFFPNAKYIGCDVEPGENVDAIMDICKIQLISGMADAVICVEALEHVRYPWKAAGEVYRILKAHGVAIFSSVFAFGIHNPPDYWRFTPQGFEVLFEMFPGLIVDWAGKPDNPHTVVAYCWKNGLPDGVNDFLKSTEEWMKKE